MVDECHVEKIEADEVMVLADDPPSGVNAGRAREECSVCINN